MKQPGVFVVLIIFVVVVSFVVASQQANNEKGVTIALSGTNVPDGLGDADGSGVFKFTVKSQGRQLCYELSTANIGAATTATLNTGDRSSIGSVLLALEPPTSGRSQGCVSGNAEIISDIAGNPTRYYVNVTNAEFPNGAIRGQLK